MCGLRTEERQMRDQIPSIRQVISFQELCFKGGLWSTFKIRKILRNRDMSGANASPREAQARQREASNVDRSRQNHIKLLLISERS